VGLYSQAKKSSYDCTLYDATLTGIIGETMLPLHLKCLAVQLSH